MVWERRVRGDGGHGHACGQDAGEDVGVGEEVEGRWTHCDLHVSCHTYLLILENEELCIGKINKWYTRYTLLLVFYRLKIVPGHHWDQAVMFTSKWVRFQDKEGSRDNHVL